MLPVSRVVVAVQEPTSWDELFVVETTLDAPRAALELAQRVVIGVEADPIDWSSLPAVDLDAAVLTVRRAWMGDDVRADAVCPDAGCRERIEVAFNLADYLEHHRPRPPRRTTLVASGGWFVLEGTSVRFRVPTVADRIEASSDTAPLEALTRACVDPPQVPRAVARRLDTALSALAPRLDDLVGGHCPACGQAVTMRFDPLSYTLLELGQLFAGIHHQIHALASAYGWPEEAILALPRRRRVRYAALIADERSAA